MVDRPDVDTPQGAEPTGTNGRGQHNTHPLQGWRHQHLLRSLPAAICTNTHRRSNTRNTRPPSGPQAARTPRPPHGSAELKIRGGHGLGETPGPIPNPEAKTQHGNGTAPGRVWESSTPPPQHEKKGGILRRQFLRIPPFSYTCLRPRLHDSSHPAQRRTPSRGTWLIGTSKVAFHLGSLRFDLREH